MLSIYVLDVKAYHIWQGSLHRTDSWYDAFAFLDVH